MIAIASVSAALVCYRPAAQYQAGAGLRQWDAGGFPMTFIESVDMSRVETLAGK